MRDQNDDGDLLVVLGATGQQGGAILRYFTAQGSDCRYKLRGITRNLQSKAAQDLQTLGVEMVTGDLDSLASLQAAFSGATHIFAITDSNQNIFHAIRHPEVLSADQTPRSFAREKELVHGQNIADAAASTENLQRLVWSSLPSPKKWSGGAFTKVTMFDTKDEIREIMLATPGLRGKLSTLLIGFYATNALNVPLLYGPKNLSSGSYELALPMSGTIPVPFADLDADLGSWTSALFQSPPGLTLVGSTETKSWAAWLQSWARRNNVKATYRHAPVAEYSELLPGISDALCEEFAFVEQLGFDGGDESVVYPDDLRRNGIAIAASTLQQHIDRSDWSSLL